MIHEQVFSVSVHQDFMREAIRKHMPKKALRGITMQKQLGNTDRDYSLSIQGVR